jgi:hypothetical protein
MGNRFCYEIHNHAIVTVTLSISQDIFSPPEAPAKRHETVAPPAPAWAHTALKNLGSCFRRNDVEGLLQEAPPLALIGQAASC